MSDLPARRIVMVAAVADNGVIGRRGAVPWHIPEDLKHFRAVTRGHTVIMGRTTFEGIGHPLPYRTNVVVTRSPDWHHHGVFVAPDVDRAIQLALGLDAGLAGDIVIGGGTQVYAAAFPRATHQILTEVHQSPVGDAHYPAWDREAWVETRRQPGPGCDWVWWERRADR